MATYGTDFDEFTAGAASTNLTGFTVQLATNTTSAVHDLGSGDHVLRHTLSSNGWAVVTKDGFGTAGVIEAVVKKSIVTDSDVNAAVGACLAQSDNQAYAWRRTGVGLWRISLFSTTGTVTSSVGFSDVAFSEPTDGSPWWTLIGRDGSGNVYGSLWIADGGRPGSPMASVNPTTDLTTVGPGMCSLDSSDDPFDFRWFGCADVVGGAPESAGGGGGSVLSSRATLLGVGR